MNLYLLNHTNTKEYDVDSDSDTACLRPYVVQPVDLSNMLLLVIDTNCGRTNENPLRITHSDIIPKNSSSTLACLKAEKALKRKRPQSCVRSHKNESEIKDQCGLAANFQPNLQLISISFLLFCYQLRSYIL